MIDRMTVKQCLEAIKNETKRSFSISTEFGIVDITKKEALRMIETLEDFKTVVVTLCDYSENNSQFILEYPEN